jgi:predicted DNA-binding transcriptional regulator AlpA
MPYLSSKRATVVSATLAPVLLPSDVKAASLIRLPAVAAVCDAGRSTILNWVRQGRFPAPVRFGNYTAWKSSEVAAWCADPDGWVKTQASGAGV